MVTTDKHLKITDSCSHRKRNHWFHGSMMTLYERVIFITVHQMLHLTRNQKQKNKSSEKVYTKSKNKHKLKPKRDGEQTNHKLASIT